MKTFLKESWELAAHGWLGWLLLLVPAAVVLNATHQAPVVVFLVAAAAVIPLAGLLGRATEEVAARMRRQKETPEDEILGELQYIRHRINAASQILTDRQRTAFFFVVIPEQMILIDTRKAAGMFAKFDVPIAGYIVNRVLPDSLSGDDVPQYLRKRFDMQHGQLEEIKREFGDQVQAHVPELERDVTGLEMIERVATLMYGPMRS